MTEEYIKNSNKRSKKAAGELKFGSIQVLIKDQFGENNIDIDFVMEEVTQKVPPKFLQYIDYVIIGQFKELRTKSVNAAYMDGAIYVTNTQDDEEDMIDDIVHEISHANEETYAALIYADGKIVNEFLGKRKKLLDILNSEGYNISIDTFMDTEYSRDFDMFLYKEVGYEKLTMFTMGLFVSPYGATSLREYFANGFEHYFLHDSNYVKIVSPAVYEKVDGITFMEI